RSTIPNDQSVPSRLIPKCMMRMFAARRVSALLVTLRGDAGVWRSACGCDTPEFGSLRQEGGLSGYPSRRESEHDLVENSHASTSLSYADGMAKAYQLRGEHDRTVVAVIGDGALTGGMAWEALNNIAVAKGSRLVIVVNDNGRSYQPTIGGLATHLAAVRASQRYEQVLEYIKTSLSHAPLVGPPLYETLH